MKKVRLFAVAAAMGMFAATVNAAAPKVTKDTFVGTWGEMETVVKAEFGGKVVLPTANITVTKQTLSTDKKYAPKVTGDYGVGSLTSKECYVGFTSEVGKDTNNDGIVDYPLMAWGNGYDGAKFTNVSDFWLYNDAKYFPTAKTSMYYFGMTSNGYGARFLAPKQAARDGVIVVDKLTHKDDADTQVNYHGWYANTDEGNQALVDMYIKAGKLSAVKDSYGDVIGYKTAKASNKYNVIKLTTDAQKSKYALADLNEEIVKYVTGLAVKSTVVDVIEMSVATTATADSAQPVEYIVGDLTDANTAVDSYEKVSKGNRYEVKETRDGFEFITDSSHAVAPIAGEIKDANGNPIATSADHITLVINNGSKYGYEVFARIKAAALATGDDKYAMHWNIADGIFEKKGVNSDQVLNTNVPTVVNPDTTALRNARIAAFGGAYRVDTPENTTDKYVVDFGMGAYLEDLNGQVSASKGTLTFDYYDIAEGKMKELVVPATKLGYTWYPAFSTEADLLDFVGKMTGYRKASADWFKEVKDAGKLVSGKRTWANGVVELDYVPANQLDHYKAKQCAYSTGEAVAVNAADVTVTSDISAVDVNKGGVYTAKLVASVGGVEVGTKDITVVVAPKYVREYKNGKVVSLKAYHLNGGLYSHTSFDYAKNTSTAVFYAQDGVTAVDTVTSTIK